MAGFRTSARLTLELEEHGGDVLIFVCDSEGNRTSVGYLFDSGSDARLFNRALADMKASAKEAGVMGI